jgi:hypothetical protein
MGTSEFDFDEVFGEDYLRFYRPLLAVDLLDADGDALAALSRRMITIAHR